METADLQHEETRITLRREAHDINDTLFALAAKLHDFNPDAAVAVERAHLALFEAWTALCEAPQDDEDH